MIKQTKNAILFLNKAYRAIYAHAYLKGLANSLALISCVAVAPCANAGISEQCTLSADGKNMTCQSAVAPENSVIFKYDDAQDFDGYTLEVSKDSSFSDVTTAYGSTVTNNTLTVDDSTINGTPTGAQGSLALKNKVSISNSKVVKGDIIGGLGSKEASENTVELTKVTQEYQHTYIDENGNKFTWSSDVFGGKAESNATVKANNNTVTVTNSNVGGVHGAAWNAQQASGNKVTITGSTAHGIVSGGESYIDTEDKRDAYGVANSNTVEFKNSTFEATGFQSGFKGGGAAQEARDNTILISNSKVNGNGYESGGRIISGDSRVIGVGNKVIISDNSVINSPDACVWASGQWANYNNQNEDRVTTDNKLEISDSNVTAFARAASLWVNAQELNFFPETQNPNRAYTVGINADMSRNTATISNSTVNAQNNKISAISAAVFEASWAGFDDDTRDFRGVKLDSNTLNIEKGSVINGNAIAASATTQHYDTYSKETMYSQLQGTVTNNTLTVADSTVNGNAIGAQGADAKKNKVSISNSKVVKGDIIGGLGTNEASENTVELTKVTQDAKNTNTDENGNVTTWYSGVFGGKVDSNDSLKSNNNVVSITDSNVGCVNGGAWDASESNGNKVTITSSTVRADVAGGQSWGKDYSQVDSHGAPYRDAFGVANNNTVEFKDSTFESTAYQSGIKGGAAGIESSGNTVLISNSKLKANGFVDAGRVMAANNRVKSVGNKLSITNKSEVDGYAQTVSQWANYDYQDDDHVATGNELLVADSTVKSEVEAVSLWVNAQIEDFCPEALNPYRAFTIGTSADISKNTAVLENATVDSVATVKFSAAWAGDKLDTRDFSGVKLDSNTLTISGNTKVAKDVYAASSTTYHMDLDTKETTYDQLQGSATNNVLTVNGGTFEGNVAAARASIANNNTLNLLGGTFAKHVYAVNASTEAKNNKVNIGAEGKAPTDLNLSSTTIAAYDKSSSQDLNHESNSLNVYTKDLVANNVEAFDEYNFYLPVGIANGDKILTLTDENRTDVSNSTIGVTLQNGATLNQEDKISLITNANGLNAKGIKGGLDATTEDGSITKKFTLSTDDNTIFATYGGKTEVNGFVDGDATSSSKPEGDLTAEDITVNAGSTITGNVIAANTDKGNVSDATVSITNSTVEKDVIAGQAGVGTVANSKVEIGGDDTVISGTVSAGKVDNGTVIEAKVTLNGGTVKEIIGGIAKTGEAVKNVVDLVKGTVEGKLFGGKVEDNGIARNNTVNLKGGIVDYVFGGEVDNGGQSKENIVNLLGATVTKIFGGSCDTAKGNVTNLIDGTVKKEVYAGHGDVENIDNVINIGSETQSDLSKLDLTAAKLHGGKEGTDNKGNTLNVYGKTKAKGVVDFDNYNFYNVKVNEQDAHLALTDDVDLTDSKITVELAKGTNLTVGDTVNLISTQGTLTADNAAIDAGLKAKSGAVLEYSFGLDNVNNNSLVATAKTAEASGTLQDLSLSQLSGLLATKQTTEMVAYKGIPVARDVLASSKANDTFSVAPFVVASYGNNEYGDGETVKVKGADFMIGLALGINTGAGDITLGAYYDNHTGDHDTSSHFGSADGDNSSNGAGLLARFDAVQLGVGNPYAEATFRFGKMDTDTKSSSICDTQGRTLNVSNDADYVAGHFGIGYDMKFDKLGADVYAKYFFTKLDGVDVDVLGDTVKLDSVSSKTLRLGTNLSYALDSGLTPYFGLAYENESDAKAEGTVLGYKLKNTDVKGSSGLVSVGAQFTPTSAQGFSLDASLDGYFGNRQGVIGNIQASYKF